MSTGLREYRSEFVRKNVNQGRAEGEVRAVLAVLAARGIDVPDHAHTRITECTDPNQLETWIRRAATATSINDLFAPGEQQDK